MTFECLSSYFSHSWTPQKRQAEGRQSQNQEGQGKSQSHLLVGLVPALLLLHFLNLHMEKKKKEINQSVNFYQFIPNVSRQWLFSTIQYDKEVNGAGEYLVSESWDFSQS